jgi:hypothetical protein
MGICNVERRELLPKKQLSTPDKVSETKGVIFINYDTAMLCGGTDEG